MRFESGVLQRPAGGLISSGEVSYTSVRKQPGLSRGAGKRPAERVPEGYRPTEPELDNASEGRDDSNPASRLFGGGFFAGEEDHYDH